MVYRCARPPSTQFSLLTRPVVPNLNDDVCVDPEPTVRIAGRNGVCVDVRGEEFYDGNPIQLWPCKSNTDWNQLWTLRKDGTIRYNGKCFTTTTVGATRWQIWDNRTIINPISGLVLEATSGNNGTTLIVQTNIRIKVGFI
ncbi:ricin-agglutinin family protein, partial [Ricinus communis]